MCKNNMIENKKYPSQPFNWLLFLISLPMALIGILTLLSKTTESSWTTTPVYIIWALLPVFFYTEILKFRQGYSKISVTTDKLFKCRVSGTDEVFYVKADSEQELELFFGTMMEGKNVFTEEANIKLLSFDMEIPKEKK